MHFLDGENLVLSGNRFQVEYHLTGNQEEAYAKAKDICVEQTIEFPDDLVVGKIQDEIIGKIESFEKLVENKYRAIISYAEEIASGELTQLLNVIFGNISLKPGIRVEHLELTKNLFSLFQGPRFGIEGIRNLLNVKDRPLLFTAIKPMGLSSKQLSDFAYQFALGGIDIIKDDHGLSNQSFSTFEERVKYSVDAVNRANHQTGRKAIYVPNIVAPAHQILERAYKAKELGAGGLLIAPGLTGLDTMRMIAEDEKISLPIFNHPAFFGSYVLSESGISHKVLFGQFARLAGSDAVIYPNFSGRFSFSQQECESIVDGAKAEFGHLKSIFPCPAGGMSLSSVPKMLEVYGKDVMFLVGGGLFKHGKDLVENSRYFLDLVK